MTRPSFRWLFQPRLLLATLAICLAVTVGVTWVRGHQPDPDALTSQAYELIKEGDLDSARLVLAELHRLHPENAEVVETLAKVCILAGDEEAALEWLQKVPVSVPQSAIDAAYRGAQLAMQWNRPSDARQCLNHCLQLRPDHAAARRLLMHLELILTRWEAMFAQVTELDQLGQATPADIALYCVERNFYWEDNSHLEWLKASVEKSPDDCLVRTALAYYDRLEGQLARANSLLQDSDFSKSGFESWRLNLGVAEVHLDRGSVQRARTELSQLPPAGDANLRT